MTIVALIPARAGSRRIPGKNTKLLAGHPLIAYTIAAAQQSGIFARVCLCTENFWIGGYAGRYGCLWVGRSLESATDDAPDILWVREALQSSLVGPHVDAFAILRPTSPFRSAEHIRQAYEQFLRLSAPDGQDRLPTSATVGIDSLRAVRPVKEHPFKTWVIRSPHEMVAPYPRIVADGDQPCHSLPTQTLLPHYIQTSSLEIAWTRVIHDTGTISGSRIAPWIVEDANGFALDTPADWAEAERLITTGEATLPALSVAPLSSAAPAQ